MKFLILLLSVFLFSCATKPVPKPPIVGTFLRITELNPDKWTAITRQNLEQLLQIYHLSHFIITNDVFIEPKATPHSHPTLTLNTRFAEHPNKLLAAFLHEQLHWWSAKKKPAFERAVNELAPFYKGQKKAVIHHMLICYLEYDALTFYLGKAQATKILREFIFKEKVHPWLYMQALKREIQFRLLVKKHRLRAYEKASPQKKTETGS